MRSFAVLIMVLIIKTGDAQLINDSSRNGSPWTYHFQLTGIYQTHPSFSVPYKGMNSFSEKNEEAFSVTSTLFLGRKLWKGAALYVNPEMAGGRGLSSALGIAGFTNGETFRIGSADPKVYFARVVYTQHFALGHPAYEQVANDVNQVEDQVPLSRITIHIGKFALADYFDDNSVSHDPRNDFMNWSLMSNGAYDYAANTRGYTYGAVIEWVRPGWAVRAGTALMPQHANGLQLDWHYGKARNETIELEKSYSLGQHPGTIRLMGYYNVSKAPAYKDVVNDYVHGTDTSLDVITGREYGGKKTGMGLNAEQELNSHFKAFIRLGWNDGKTATWAFTEVDNTATIGVRWYHIGKKELDGNMGLAIVSNGISKDHRSFLDHGGYGFMIGDGKLPNYGRENIVELFYQLKLFTSLWASADYQFVQHPAYNRDRGPLHVFAFRAHVGL